MADDDQVSLEEANQAVVSKQNSKLNKENSWLTFAQVFSLICFAEWGDKSQLSTVLLVAREVSACLCLDSKLG